MTRKQPKALVLVPGQKGGIDRLFAHVTAGEQPPGVRVDLELFTTHGPMLIGLTLFPFRLLRFLCLCLLRRFDVCHINLSHRGSTVRKLFFGAICRAFSRPYLVHIHAGQYPDFYAGLPAAAQKRVQDLLRGAARVVILGSYIEGFVRDSFDLAPAKVQTLPNAVVAPQQPPAEARREQPPRILFLGKIEEAKGAYDFAEALAKPCLAALPWSATIAGNGEVDTARETIQRLALQDRVDVPGWLAAAQVRGLLESARILVLPSYTEGLPLSMLEGMGYGLCPVVTPVGSIVDVIRDGENGVFVPVGNADALAKALAGLLTDPASMERMAARARLDYEANYGIRDYRLKLDRIYAGILGLAADESDARASKEAMT